ncbi:MAG: YdiU family protein [Candidatus Eremiobacteraeota bacterium]|nr:YdiU family protein [Candidatus Eremiobacteraeota bacterium]MBC5802147.1 YdiU family protein [Candidatus Eremiobacteraeota bacterium]MBC5821726.1 YdiU family protein [Candidatus Eremiobacteraeota bacterium]
MLTRARAATLESLMIGEGYSSLGDEYVERRDPTPLRDPYLIAFSPDVAALVGLEAAQAERPEFLRLAAGCSRFEAVAPYAAVYAGHQFGSFVPQLGDGRAITLGEVETADGARYEWQIKGAGQTAFSRFGDGRAVLRSTIREYLGSEAMAGLGIPTTRALAIAGSDEPVFRETPETAGVLTRIAPSHLRFGTFEYFHDRSRFEAVRAVADYAIANFFPGVARVASDADRYAQLLHEVVGRTARLIAQWQAVGFAHGVMNTDNMSILGLTLDYGPFGFLDAFDPGFICNHTDVGGRYAFDRQPAVALWNCHALAAALSSLVSKDDAAAALAAFAPAFQARYAQALADKFGLGEPRPDDPTFFADALAALARNRVDYTIFFRALSSLSFGDATSFGDAAASPQSSTLVAGDADACKRLIALFENRADAEALLQRYRARIALESRDDAARMAAMRRANPKYVLRNYLAENAIRAARERDYSDIARLHAVLRDPFDEHPQSEAYAGTPPPWAAELSVSCSS